MREQQDAVRVGAETQDLSLMIEIHERPAARADDGKMLRALRPELHRAGDVGD